MSENVVWSDDNRVSVNFTVSGPDVGQRVADVNTYRDEAEAFRDQAGVSATNAATSESNASTSETNASNSEVAAASSETNAAASETASATSESNAATSESNAATSETNAAISEINANASAVASQVSADASEASKVAAAAIFDQFGDQYLGPKATEPTVDNDGDPLDSGDIYWNTTNNTLHFYNGSSWVAPETVATAAAANALNSENAAAASETNAAASEAVAVSSAADAGVSETNALASETASSISETNSSISETNALASENKAQQWAENDEDVEIDPGEYSAKHWAQKALDNANGLLDLSAYPYLTQNEKQNYWLEHLLAKVGTSVQPTPSLVLDFENDVYKVGGESKTFAEAITYTRASDATLNKASGKVATVLTDAPQFTYDPATKERALLLEPARTNLLTESEFANGLADVSSSGHVTATTFDGLNDGTGLAFGHDGVTDSSAYKVVNLTGEVPVTLSVFVIMDDGLAPNFGSGSVTSSLNDFVLVIDSGASNAGLPTDYKVQNIAGNLYRVSASVSSQVSAYATQGVFKYATNSSRTFKVSGYMLEEGSYPTSYIKTGVSTVTRAKPTTRKTLGDWFNQGEGTFLIEGYKYGVATAPQDQSLISIYNNNTPTDDFLILHFNEATDFINVTSKQGGVVNPSVHISSPISSGYKAAVAWGETGTVAAVNGLTNSITETNITPRDTLNIGDWSGNPLLLGAKFKKITYYPKALTEAQLIALTSGVSE